MKTKSKTETLAEYLARGGTIKVVPANARESQNEPVKQVQGGPAKILTYEEADLYLGEGKPRKVKPKPKSTLDLSALPEALRKKFLERYKGDVDGEEQEN